MKLKRFVEADMRTALARIKEELGPEAVIMSNKRAGGKVEIVAGIEESVPKTQESEKKTGLGDILADEVGDDEVSLSSQRQKRPAKKTAAPAKDERISAKASESKSESFARSLLEILERQKASRVKTAPATEKKTEIQSGSAPKPKAAKPKRAAPAPLSEQSGIGDIIRQAELTQKRREEAEREHGISSYAAKAQAQDSGDLAKMREDMEGIRKLLQFELAGLIRDKGAREQPVRAMLTEVLISSGFDRALARSLTSEVSADASVNFAWRELFSVTEKKLKTGNDEIVSDGGAVALIGPAGVGKTTTIAKLAARFVITYGADRVAIVTADHYRIGAVEQVKTYGRIMGCTAMAVNSLSELPQALMDLRDKSLVLVDTAGVGMNDERFKTQLAALKAQKQLKLRHYLVLPATAQRRVLEQAYTQFSELGIKGLILTKTDESQNLCDALSLCLSHGLTLSYTADGQRVPEDLKVPQARQFVAAALGALENESAQQALGA
ncbi:MAG: flagellar biosynthesis protein FlhF [Succinivibrio sp.]|jgi:flagellar biosynthesis protein FlhF|nr:flagellar biosynthesis protein FlhF [Succinivibrio sp.]